MNRRAAILAVFLLSWETCADFFFLFLAKEKHTWKYNILGKNRVIQFY